MDRSTHSPETDHAEQLAQAIDLMEARLCRPLDLAALARDCGFSYWHFHRIFHALTGETPKAYVRKRRLSEASRRIMAGERILDLALDYQFESQEAFTRAFRQRFYVNPGEFRMRGVEDFWYFPRLVLDQGQREGINCLLNTSGDLVRLEPLRLFGREHRGANDHPLNMQVLLDMRRYVAESREPRHLYALSFTLNQDSTPEYHYQVGFFVPPLPGGPACPPGLNEFVLPGGVFARFRFQGSPKVLNLDMYSWLYGVWSDRLPRKIDYQGITVEQFKPDYRCLEHSGLDFFVPLLPQEGREYPVWPLEP